MQSRYTESLCFVAMLVTFSSVSAQALSPGNQGATLAESLGYEPDEKLLIVHADDIGFSHSANAATTAAFANSALRTGSVMVPAPWFPDIAEWARSNPDHDLGVHITLTSEWKFLKWDGVLSSDRISSLLAEDGYFYGTGPAVAEHAEGGEARAEARAQIERAIAFGIDPTHLDVHNSALWGTPELFQVYLDLGREYRLPILMSNDGIAEVPPEYRELLRPEDIVLDRIIMMARGTPVEDWETEYARLLSTVGPGVTELIIHFGYDDPELQAIVVDRPNPDAAWRQADYDYFTGPRFQEALQANNIRLVTWREIRELLR